MAVRPPRSGSSLTVASTTAPSTQTDDPIAHAVRSFSRPSNVAGYARILAAANTLKDLQDIVHELKSRGVALRATEQPVDTGTAAGKAFLDMLGVFAEFETNLRRERQLEGIAQAKARGVYRGRKPNIDIAEIRRLRQQDGLGPTAIARRLGIGRASVYRALGAT
jgi:DNA invertase Pin-like site-specific DNA recombinase